jgi:hypothetical protein
LGSEAAEGLRQLGVGVGVAVGAQHLQAAHHRQLRQHRRADERTDLVGILRPPAEEHRQQRGGHHHHAAQHQGQGGGEGQADVDRAAAGARRVGDGQLLGVEPLLDALLVQPLQQGAVLVLGRPGLDDAGLEGEEVLAVGVELGLGGDDVAQQAFHLAGELAVVRQHA